MEKLSKRTSWRVCLLGVVGLLLVVLGVSDGEGYLIEYSAMKAVDHMSIHEASDHQGYFNRYLMVPLYLNT